MFLQVDWPKYKAGVFLGFDVPVHFYKIAGKSSVTENET